MNVASNFLRDLVISVLHRLRQSRTLHTLTFGPISGVHFIIDNSSAADLGGVTFAFVCVDKGSARAEIFDLLIRLRIPFIDVGMGLNRKQGPLAGTLRVTSYSQERASEVRDMQLAELTDHPDDEYSAQVQISELNAMNASIAVMLYKQFKGFYVHDDASYHLLLDTTKLRIYGQDDS